MTQEALKVLIEDLRLNHEYCPKEIILQAADELERLAQRTWVGLTRDEQSFVYSSLHNATSREDSFWVDFANAIEAKLKEKNNAT